MIDISDAGKVGKGEKLHWRETSAFNASDAIVAEGWWFLSFKMIFMLVFVNPFQSRIIYFYTQSRAKNDSRKTKLSSMFALFKIHTAVMH